MRNRIMSVLLILLSTLILLGVGLTAYMLFNAEDFKPKKNDQTQLAIEISTSVKAESGISFAFFRFT